MLRRMNSPFRPLVDSLFVGIGAAIGANARYWIGYWAKANVQAFPWPTLLINVVGSFALGVFAAFSLAKGWSEQWRLFVAVGLCGGFTTFSTFSYECIALIYERNWRSAAVYAALSLILCLLGTFLGVHLGRQWTTLGVHPFAK